MSKFFIQLNPDFPGSPVYLGTAVRAEEIKKPDAEKFAIVAQQQLSVFQPQDSCVVVGFMDWAHVAARRLEACCKANGSPSMEYQKGILKLAEAEIFSTEIKPSFAIDKQQLAIFHLNGFNASQIVSANLPESKLQVAVCEVRGISKHKPPAMHSIESENELPARNVPEITTQPSGRWFVAHINGVYSAYPMSQPGMRPC
jgi:hypothetical protein